jgi:hypothetical protein
MTGHLGIHDEAVAIFTPKDDLRGRCCRSRNCRGLGWLG